MALATQMPALRSGRMRGSLDIGSGMKLSDEAAALIAAQYVLGGLTPAVRRAVERRATRDHTLATELRRWHERSADLALSTAAVEVPERVWQIIRAQLPAAAATRAGAAAEPWWRRIWIWQSWAAAAALALTIGVLPTLYRAPANEALLSAPLSAPLAAPRPPQHVGAVPRAVGPGTATPRSAAAMGQPALTSAARMSGVQPPAEALPATDTALQQRAATSGVLSSAPAGGAQRVARASTTLPVAGPARAAAAAVPPTAGGAAADAAPQRVAAVPVSPSRRTFATRGASGDGTTGATSVLESKQGVKAWQVRLDETAGELRVTVLAGQNAGATHDFQLWAIPDDGGPPRAIGLIAGDRDVVLPVNGQLQRAVRMAEVLAVSVEPVGGAPGDAPTGPVNYTGRVEKI